MRLTTKIVNCQSGDRVDSRRGGLGEATGNTRGFPVHKRLADSFKLLVYNEFMAEKRVSI